MGPSGRSGRPKQVTILVVGLAGCRGPCSATSAPPEPDGSYPFITILPGLGGRARAAI
jgi:hypothetical protein